MISIMFENVSYKAKIKRDIIVIIIFRENMKMVYIKALNRIEKKDFEDFEFERNELL